MCSDFEPIHPTRRGYGPHPCPGRIRLRPRCELVDLGADRGSGAAPRSSAVDDAAELLQSLADLALPAERARLIVAGALEHVRKVLLGDDPDLAVVRVAVA